MSDQPNSTQSQTSDPEPSTNGGVPTTSSNPQEAPPRDPSAPLKSGEVLNGEITNITHFGAFVRLENGSEGLVHISEIANEYVTDITKFVAVGQAVQVRVLNTKDPNKLELSIKKVSKQDTDPQTFTRRKSKDSAFEDRLTSFLKKSEEKQIDIRRNLKNKQGITKKKK